MNVLVVGGASGLGRALVELSRLRGDTVTVLDHDASGLEIYGSRIETAVCDIADRRSIEAALERISAAFRFDLVAITAGVSFVGRFEEIDPGEMARVLATNVTGTMMLVHALVTGRRIARGGRLVLTSSLSHYIGYPGASVYAASKDGVVAFGKSIAQDLRREQGIIVQIAAPGPMDTPHAERHAPLGSRRDRRAKPEAIAASVLRRRRAGLFVPGFAPSLMAVMGRLFPDLAARIMRDAIYKRLP